MMIRCITILLIASFLGLACSKKNSTPVPESRNEYFRGNLNGTPFNDTSLGRIINYPGQGIQVSGYHPQGGIILWLKTFSGSTGEYAVGQDNSVFIGNNGGIFYASVLNGQLQGSGRIHLLEISARYIRGTFECVAPSDSSYAVLPAQVITAGEFQLKKP